MKLLITISLILNFLACYSQEETRCEVVKEFDTPYRPATIILIKNNIQVDSSEAGFNGVFIYNILNSGRYKIIFSGRGQEAKTIDNIVVEENQILKLKIKIQGPCLYDYPANYIPICPENHIDNIIPIVYGFVGRQLRPKDQNQKDNDTYSGGCVTTGCDPKFYCTVHKIKF